MKNIKSKTLSVSLAVLIGASVGLPSAAAAPAKVPESFTYNGGGWGHGVGMSQYGAYGMALEGKTAKQILEHYYNPAKLSNSTAYANSDIRVQLVGGLTTTSVTPRDGQLRLRFDGKSIATSKTASFAVKGDKIDVNINGQKYTTSGNHGVIVEWQNTRYWNSGNKNTTVSIPKTNEGVGTGTFRHGKVTVKLLNKKINVVNSLRLNDEYLYGLAEVPSSWPKETLKAQAIAGRTYALRNMRTVKSNCDCNVYDEVQSQKFTGWSKENESNGVIGKKWVQAVNETVSRKSGTPTSGQVMTYNGGLIEALYSSTTGGKTRAAKSVWGNDLPYLQSRDDHWALKKEVRNPNASWSYTITQAKAAKGYSLPDVKSISIKISNEGTLVSSTATSSTGKKSTLTYSQTRSLFGAKSVWAKNIIGNGQTNSVVDVKPTGSNPTPVTPKPVTPKPQENTVKAGVTYKTTSGLNMRSGAGTSNKVLKVLNKGTVVTTTGKKSGAWLQVKASNATGWVSSSYLTAYTAPKPAPTPVKKPAATPPKAPAVAKTTSYVTTANLNIREKASASSRNVGLFKKGSKVEVYSISKGWAKVKNGSKTSYVSSSYITKPSPNKNTKPSIAKHKADTKKTTANLHLRAGANTSQKSLKVVPKGMTVTLTGKKSGAWLQVKYGSTTGWMHSGYLK